MSVHQENTGSVVERAAVQKLWQFLALVYMQLNYYCETCQESNVEIKEQRVITPVAVEAHTGVSLNAACELLTTRLHLKVTAPTVHPAL